MNVATGHHYLPLAPSYHRTTTQPGQGQVLTQRLHGPAAAVAFNPADRHQTHHQLHQLLCNQSNPSLSPSVTPPSPVITRGNVSVHGYHASRPSPSSTSFILQANQNNANVHRAFLTPTSVVKFGSMLETSAVAACHRVHGRQLNKWLVHACYPVAYIHLFKTRCLATPLRNVFGVVLTLHASRQFE